MHIAVLNAGSGTIKTALVEIAGGKAQVRMRQSLDLAHGSDPGAVVRAALDTLDLGHDVDAVGHRVVHGGGRFTEPVRIDAVVEETIESLARFAPLHNPVGLAGIRSARERFPGRPMVAVFDTAFHARRPAESLRYALGWDLCESLGLWRYGFHGIAHASLVEAVAEAECVGIGDVTAVTLQLGAGCSACAVEQGRSIETSMGFSPLGGLPMATRSGDLDPAVVLELMRHGHAVHEVDDMLTHRSGLYGVAGVADMRDILRAESDGAERATLAVALFVRALVAVVGAYFTLLGGEGALVFGGGIGTHSPEIRRRVAAGLAAWDVELDPERNTAGVPGRISGNGSRPVYVFETNEERLIARSTYALLHSGEP